MKNENLDPLLISDSTKNVFKGPILLMIVLDVNSPIPFPLLLSPLLLKVEKA
jgi:hypothetical protein